MSLTGRVAPAPTVTLRGASTFFPFCPIIHGHVQGLYDNTPSTHREITLLPCLSMAFFPLLVAHIPLVSSIVSLHTLGGRSRIVLNSPPVPGAPNPWPKVVASVRSASSASGGLKLGRILGVTSPMSGVPSKVESGQGPGDRRPGNLRFISSIF